MAVLFCSQCGASIEGERRYCPRCGAALQPKDTSRMPEPEFMQLGDMGMDTGTNTYQNSGTGYYNRYNGYNGIQPQVNPNQFNGCAIAGLVLGIISLVICCTSFIALLVSGAGLTCSILGLRSYSKKGCAIAGLICSIAGLLMSLFMTIIILLD